ncbi:hypothetical protein [Arenivirga flava]|uniref:Uncharacterized protein n=1 Tax=Arenivirga flava TaxID=1930060 RepID=A0AA37XA40_9MICO|nr:hypothetical protein [Arenivirga flava]GMA27060.1 hypothetical protein GCM10025874_03130 [Arenivirga flava]
MPTEPSPVEPADQGIGAIVTGVNLAHYAEEIWMRAAQRREEHPGEEYQALRYWLTMVYAALATWHELREEYPSTALSEAWEHPNRDPLRLLRNKTIHGGKVLVPPEVLAYYALPDGIEWAHAVYSELAALVAEHYLGWSPEKIRESQLGPQEPWTGL